MKIPYNWHGKIGIEAYCPGFSYKSSLRIYFLVEILINYCEQSLRWPLVMPASWYILCDHPPCVWVGLNDSLLTNRKEQSYEILLPRLLYRACTTSVLISQSLYHLSWGILAAMSCRHWGNPAESPTVTKN